MEFIKEYVKRGDDHSRVVIRTRTYRKNFKHIAELVNEARKDFSVSDEDIDVNVYGGVCYKGTYGIEFNVICAVPDAYREIRELEFTA